MTIHRFPHHGLILTFILAATGCSAFAAAADLSHSAREAAWSLEADAAASARPMRGRAEFRAGSATLSGIGNGHAPEADAPFIAPAEPAGTQDIARGAVLDVWLNDRRRDLRALTSEPSLGSAIVQGDFFRYTSVNSHPDLRGFWGQPLLLKWSALLEITAQGPHVFVSNLSKERGWGAMTVRTLVRLNEETLFEKEVRVFGSNEISEVNSRALTLAPGFYNLEVWLAAENALALPPGTQLGTFITMREPGVMTGEPLPPSRIWYRVRPN